MSAYINGYSFSYDPKRLMCQISGHKYYSARQKLRDPLSGTSRFVDDRKYILVECQDVWPEDPSFQCWFRHMQELERSHPELAHALLMPVLQICTPGGNAAWFARMPDNDQNYKPVSVRSIARDHGLLCEMVAYAHLLASELGLSINTIFANEETGRLMIDTSPSRQSRSACGTDWLQRFLRLQLPQFPSDALIRRPRSLYEALCLHNDRRASLQKANAVSSPVGADLLCEMIRPDCASNRSAHIRLTLAQSTLLMKSVLPDTPVLRMTVEKASGLLRLESTRGTNWVLNRYYRKALTPGEPFVLRIGDVLTSAQPDGSTLRITVTDFDVQLNSLIPRPSASAPERVAPQPIPPRPLSSDVPGKTSQPSVSTIPQERAEPKTAPAAVPPDPLNKLYSCKRFPKPGQSCTATEIAGNRTVRITHCPQSETALRAQMLALAADPPEAAEGLCRLIRVHEDVRGGSFAAVSEYQDTEGFVPVGDARLQSLPLRDACIAGERMMRLLANISDANRVPARFREPALLVHPGTLKVCFADGAYLAKPGTLPPDCTLGYLPPEGYAPGALADTEFVSFAAAVWLYRLLVGGFPMEGAATHAAILRNQSDEESLAASLYGPDALFAFSRKDGSNRIDGLGPTYDAQILRYERLPEALREGFERTFSTCLHERRSERWSPARWADALHARIGQTEEPV